MTAIFLSAFAPGTKGGAQICSVAFLQAVCSIHDDDVIYVGPGRTECDNFPENIRQTLFVPQRPVWNKALGLIRQQFDRFSPFVEKNASRLPANPSVLYVNGETLGRFATLDRFSESFKVAYFHNHYRTYCRYQDRLLRRGRMFNRVIEQNVFDAYHRTDLRLFLTNEDRVRYRDQFERPELDQASIGNAYFGPVDGHLESLQQVWSSQEETDTNRKLVVANTSLEAPQNEAGIVRLLTEIWPKVLQLDPEVKLVLAGGVPTRKVRVEVDHSKSVEIIQLPTEEKMFEIWKQRPVAIATNEHGSGIKVRVGEALRRGATVVSTPHSATGYEQVSERVLKLFRTPDEGAEQIIRALTESNSKGRVDSCIDEFQAHYSFEQGTERLREALVNCGATIDKNCTKETLGGPNLSLGQSKSTARS